MKPASLLTLPRARYPTSDGGGRLVERIRTDDGARTDRAFVGLPFDAATPTRPGARRGPDAFRTALARFAADAGQERWPVGSRLTDLGDVAMVGAHTVDDADERVRAALLPVLHRVDSVVAIGGDQSLSYPFFRAVAEARGGTWGLIALDAHHDVRETVPGAVSSSTSVRRCLELACLEPGNVAQIGIRPFANASPHRAWCEERGIAIYDVETIRARGASAAASSALERVGRGIDHLYLSIDLDVVDQSQAPGTSAAGPGGLFVDELLEIVVVIAASPLFATADIMELSPRWDRGGETASVAARAFLAIMSADWHATTHAPALF